MIRDLRADEIEARIQSVTDKGCVVLLYKNARCDMNILDETFGSLNWKRDHCFIDGKCYCTVSVWDGEKSQWVSKQDVGTESNQDAEKGQASDAFKRACFNWGIGRELYTAPFTFIPASKCNITDRNGKKACYDTFSVDSITITNKVITGLRIVNDKTHSVVFTYGEASTPKKEEKPTETATEASTREAIIKGLLKKKKKAWSSFSEWLEKIHGTKNLDELGDEAWQSILVMLK